MGTVNSIMKTALASLFVVLSLMRNIQARYKSHEEVFKVQPLFKQKRSSIELLLDDFLKHGGDGKLLKSNVLRLVDDLGDIFMGGRAQNTSKHIERLPPHVSASPRRGLASCKDVKGWKDVDGWNCVDYENFDICGGVQKWSDFYDVHITSFGNAHGITAVDACCSCGGGEGTEKCSDIEGWSDINGLDCLTYTALEICGGWHEWSSDTWGPIEDATDNKGRSAFESCCACGGGNLETVLVDPVFRTLHRKIKSAPRSGNRTIINVKDDVILWSEEVWIKSGQNILLKGIGENKTVLISVNARRHFMLRKGATLSLQNLELRDGQGQEFMYDDERYGCGGSIYSEGTIDVVTDCIFRNNIVPNRGGSIYLFGKHAQINHISKSLFIDNYADDYGGAIYAEGLKQMKLKIANTVFGRNKGSGDASFAGGIGFVDCSGTVVISDSTFYENVAESGGAILFEESRELHTSVETSVFRANFATADGGAIKNMASNVSISNCRFVNNTVLFTNYGIGYYYRTRGGAISNYGHIREIDGCTFIGNSAEYYGNDIYAAGEAQTLIRNSRFFKGGTDGVRDVVGPIISCDSASFSPICPEPNSTCVDSLDSGGAYLGVDCHRPCTLGFFGIAPNSCTACSRGKFGLQTHLDQGEACKLCPAGRANSFFGQPGIESCKKCTNGTFSTMGAVHCLQVCAVGQEQISIDSCRECPPGKTSSEDKVKKCIPCGPGTVAVHNGSKFCASCPPGKKSNKLRTQCIDCPKGYFSSGLVDTCTRCKDDEGSSEGSDRCNACSPGYQFSLDGFSCEMCMPGMERPHTQLVCTECRSGFISPSAGRAYCDPCPDGMYSFNKTTCLECPEGFFCSRGTSYPQKCNNSDQYCPRGSSNPVSASAGTYTNGRRTKAVTCEEGYFCINGKKYPCPRNTYGNAKGLTSQSCSGECSNKLNEFSEPGAISCSCLPTFVNNSQTDFECRCPPNTYRSRNITCNPCPGNLVKAEHGDALSLCKAPELDSSSLIPYAVLVCGAITLLIVLYRVYKSESTLEALTVLASPVILSVGTVVLELVDLVGDGITCYNVLSSDHPGLSEERDAYLGITALATLAFCIGFAERMGHLRWQLRRKFNKDVRNKASNRNKKVSPEPETLPKVSTQDEDDLTEVNHDIRSVITRFFILIFEDVPFMVLNARLMIKHGYIDTAMILSQLCSAGLAGSKLRSVLYLKNLLRDRKRLRAAIKEASEQEN